MSQLPIDNYIKITVKKVSTISVIHCMFLGMSKVLMSSKQHQRLQNSGFILFAFGSQQEVLCCKVLTLIVLGLQ